VPPPGNPPFLENGLNTPMMPQQENLMPPEQLLQLIQALLQKFGLVQ
jgi:hypothetical protein